ncbi:MAG: gamma-glutamyltransferase family protein [Tannerellaceae bacterium]|nr:gamma-glutamyltransferase family protein [Tannerellaceae bacterium]
MKRRTFLSALGVTPLIGIPELAGASEPQVSQQTRNMYIWPAFHTRPTVSSRKAVVASGHYAATAAGIRILAKGGNAVDAGIAAGFALAVLKPHKDGIGGEAPTLIYTPKERKTYAISGVGFSPRALTVEWLKKQNIKSIPGFGYLGAIVPAQIGAYCTALSRFGTLPLDVVLEPAIELCYDGYPVYEALRQFLSTTEESLFTKTLPENGNIFLKNGKAPSIGELIKQPDLGATYEKLAEAYRIGSSREDGIQRAIDRFYKGDIAKAVIDYVRSFPVEDGTGNNASLLTMEDFANYETYVEEALGMDYHNYRVYKCNAWTQGPVMLQTLKVLEGYDLRKMGHNSAQYIHTLIEVMKHTYNDRNRYYGDPRFCKVPFDRLLSEEYAAGLRSKITPYYANNTKLWEDDLFNSGGKLHNDEAGDTTHLDCVDAEGFIMSSSPSGGWIRSNPRVPGVGLQLSTRGQMFYMKAGHPNSLEPGKRPRSTLTPSLVFKDGKPWMAFGTPGGDNQDQWGIQTFLNIAEFDMSIHDALDATSVYSTHFRNSFQPHGADKGYLFHEPLPAPVVNELIDRGHVMIPLEPYYNGECCAVRLNHETGMIEGGASAKEERQSYAMGW